MNAINKIAKKKYQEASPVEKLVIMAWGNKNTNEISVKAADEFAALQARVAELELALSKIASGDGEAEYNKSLARKALGHYE